MAFVSIVKYLKYALQALKLGILCFCKSNKKYLKVENVSAMFLQS